MKGTSVLGNSFHLNRTVVEEMKQAGVDFYQVSLDGLEKTHDENRRRGSFEDAIRALELLHDAGIYTSVMFTVSRSNYEEFIPLYRFVEQLGCVDVIGFDKMIPIGSAKMRSDYVSPEEYRDFLYAVYKYIVFEKPVTRFSFKDNLWKLFLDENGLLSPYQKDQDAIINGCLVCNAASISILPNGEVMPCRRLDITLDNCMHKNIEEIFDGDFYEKLLEKKQYEKCNQCDSCIKFISGNNPDYIEIIPDGNSIKISQIREMQENVYQKPIVSNKKVFIIDEAEKMTVEAQNSLLKTLEEPPEYIVIIIITSNENKMLNTVKSRCMRINFINLTPKEIENYINKNNIVVNSKNIVEMCNGSIRQTG